MIWKVLPTLDSKIDDSKKPVDVDIRVEVSDSCID